MNVVVAAALAITLATAAEYPSYAEMQARARWLTAWSCPAFKSIYYQAVVPWAKNPRDAELAGVPAGLYEKLDRGSHLPYDAAAYDAEHRVVYALDAMSFPYLLRPASGSPPLPVVRADLSGIRLRSGITIGTRASRVVAIFGKPSAQHGCGSELYTYALGPRHAAILFTIHGHRVVRIEWFGDD